MSQNRSTVNQPTCPWKRNSSTVSRTIGECHDSLEQQTEIESLEVLSDDLSFMGLVKGGAGGRCREEEAHWYQVLIRERTSGEQCPGEHLCTEPIFANVLTQKLQGEQFMRKKERQKR